MELVDYVKRKNVGLFQKFQDTLECSSLQNYSPIYRKFFNLSESNYNSVNFNNVYYICDIEGKSSESCDAIYKGVIREVGNENTTIKKDVFFKLAPLLDPFKFLIGKYNVNDPSIFNLPKHVTTDIPDTSIHPKLKDENNSSYVDGVFTYLTSRLIHTKNFIHGVDFYGSFIGLKQNFKLNIIDDLDYLCTSEYFNENKNKLFSVDDYSYLIEPEKSALKPIKIEQSTSIHSLSSIQSINDDLYNDIFEDEQSTSSKVETLNCCDNANDTSFNSLVDITENSTFLEMCGNKITTIKSDDSTCSSRTSHTSNEYESSVEDGDGSEDGTCSETTCAESDDVCSSNIEEEKIWATLPKFPINIICMEKCHVTFDNLITSKDLSHDEWFSALMQIIMILITYQRCFSFTHNDLHTNNVMYVHTDIPFIYYCCDKKYYKVPTFGRIFKIIDFGRAIYRYNSKLFCSDSFHPSADAGTQYNTEPFFNNKKPRLDPNYSFDLCRLACSMYDYVIEDVDDLKDTKTCKPIMKLINEWCTDDNNVNILYKTNGCERYPDFKLYKMIARCVHKHIPHLQLERPEFKKFCMNKKNIKLDGITLVNIDTCT